MNPFLKTALIVGPPFGILFGLIVGLVSGILLGSSNGLIFGLITAIASGCIFGGLFALMAMTFAKTKVTEVSPEFTDEKLLHEGSANHFLNFEGVGGRLFLTEKRLLFRSHQVNIQPHELSIPLADITEAQAVRTAKILPNGLRIITRSGNDERFVVENHRKWCDEILAAQRQVT